MATVEKATSLRGKTYRTAGSVTYTDLRTGGSTIITGDNVTTGNLTSANYVVDTSGTKISLDDGTIDTKNFKVDDEGNINCNNATMNDATVYGDIYLPSSSTKIIGTTGLITSFVYPSNIISNNFLGGTCMLPMAYSKTPTGYSKDALQFDFNIPSNFTITNATIKLDHIPIKHYSAGVLQATGYSRNLKLYKTTGYTTGYQYVDWGYGLFNTDNYGTWSEISSAFGASGFTGSSSGYTSTTSIDIKSSLSSGFNTLRIQTGNALVTTDLQMYQQKGACNATLTVTGYYTYS